MLVKVVVIRVCLLVRYRKQMRFSLPAVAVAVVGLQWPVLVAVVVALMDLEQTRAQELHNLLVALIRMVVLDLRFRVEILQSVTLATMVAAVAAVAVISEAVQDLMETVQAVTLAAVAVQDITILQL
jgi:hypothetical protein